MHTLIFPPLPVMTEIFGDLSGSPMATINDAPMAADCA